MNKLYQPDLRLEPFSRAQTCHSLLFPFTSTVTLKLDVFPWDVFSFCCEWTKGLVWAKRCTGTKTAVSQRVGGSSLSHTLFGIIFTGIIFTALSFGLPGWHTHMQYAPWQLSAHVQLMLSGSSSQKRCKCSATRLPASFRAFWAPSSNFSPSRQQVYSMFSN